MRSIPACAGEPQKLRRERLEAGVYPRVCGGTSADIIALPPLRGLSPRVRGNRYRYTRADFAEGSIPACAGEPVS